MNDLREEAYRWGIPFDEIQELGTRLRAFFQRFRHHLKTKTRDTSEYGYHYMSGLLRMTKTRHYANIAGSEWIQIFLLCQ